MEIIIYIAHQTLYILEDVMVNTLQTVRSLTYALRGNNKRVVDKTNPQRLRLFHFIPNGKMFQDLFHGLNDFLRCKSTIFF